MADKRSRQHAYWTVAIKAIEYNERCAELNVVPLKHDAGVFREKLNAARSSKELR